MKKFFGKKGSIELSSREIIMLILMVILAVIIIFLGVKYFEQIKGFFANLISTGETFA